MIKFGLWKDVLLNPKQTFKKEKKNANYGVAAKYVFIAGLIGGVITGLVSISTLLYDAIATPVVALIGLFLGSGIYHLFAQLLGGKGDYKTQTYLMALYTAPLSVIASVLSLLMGVVVLAFPFNIVVAPLLLIILGLSIYGVYLLTLLLKEVHGFNTQRAVMVWLIPFIILTAIVAIGAYYYLYSGVISDFPIPEI